MPDNEHKRLKSPIFYYNEYTGKWPSNSQIWWAYKRPLGVGSNEPTERPHNYIEVFDPGLRFQLSTGNTAAPKGHYLLNAFHTDRAKSSHTWGIPVETSGGARPQVCAFYASRIFYAGARSPRYNTKVYFSQILESADQVQRCYQSQDPTSEELHDLLPTDGGVIVIPELSEVVWMYPIGNALFVGADNGVWRIAGSEGIGFRANDYSVTKVSGIGALSQFSFVTAEGSPLWWNRAGIYNLARDQLGNGQVSSISQDTIQGFFDEIPEESKFYAKAAYNSLKQRVQWVYRSTPASTVEDVFDYDRILNLDMRTGAFYVYSFPPSKFISVRGIFAVEGYSVSEGETPVFAYNPSSDSNEPVLVGAEEVVVNQENRTPVSSRFKYLVETIEGPDSYPSTPPIPEVTIEFVYVSDDQVFVGSDAVTLEVLP